MPADLEFDGQQLLHQTRGQARRERAEQRTDCAADQRQQDRLTEVEPEHLPRAHAERLQSGDGVQPAGEPRPHGLGHADPTDHQRQQRDQPEELLDPVQPVAQRRLGLGVGLDAHQLGVRVHLTDRDRCCSDLVRGRAVGQADEQPA